MFKSNVTEEESAAEKILDLISQKVEEAVSPYRKFVDKG
jgi:hypothetical protein